MPAGSADWDLVWFRTPIHGYRPSRFAEAVSEIRARMAPGSIDFPESPPEMLGAELSYRAFVESLQAALPLLLPAELH